MRKESFQGGVDFSVVEQAPVPPQLFGIGQVARMLHVNISTMRNWDRTGILVPDSRSGGNGARCYTEATLLNFVNASRPTERLPFDELPEDIISLREAAEILNVSISTLRVWGKTASLPPRRKRR